MTIIDGKQVPMNNKLAYVSVDDYSEDEMTREHSVSYSLSSFRPTVMTPIASFNKEGSPSLSCPVFLGFTNSENVIMKTYSEYPS